MENSQIVKNLWSYILLLIGSFFVVHFAAVFGPFLLIIYPIVILINPLNEPCFFCILRGQNNICHIKKIFHVDKPLSIVLINVIIMILITILSIGILFLEKKLIETKASKPAHDTTGFHTMRLLEIEDELGEKRDQLRKEQQ